MGMENVEDMGDQTVVGVVDGGVAAVEASEPPRH